MLQMFVGGFFFVLAAGLIAGGYSALLMALGLLGIAIMARQMERMAERNRIQARRERMR